MKTGSCLCGGVTFEVTGDVAETGACHCGMCRKFSGGVYLGVEVVPEHMVITSNETLKIYKSSDWAERGFCETCGSSLFYRVTAPGPQNGTYHIGLGSLDEPNGVPLSGEIFIDRKPDGYAFAGERDTMTEAEVMAMFAPPPS